MDLAICFSSVSATSSQCLSLHSVVTELPLSLSLSDSARVSLWVCSTCRVSESF
uniref:Uncharacterized protein n=1 Tax=Aegilops tauschii subsp. strangulata TaxID=200361 RepID=A0A453HN27_AEGTS